MPMPGEPTAPTPVTTTRFLSMTQLCPIHPFGKTLRCSFRIPLKPSVVVVGFVLEEVLHLGMREGSENSRPEAPSTTTSATTLRVRSGRGL